MNKQIDIAEIFDLCKGIDKKKSYNEQFLDLNEKLKSNYGIEIPEQVMIHSRDKYHEIITPHLFIRIANMLIKNASELETSTGTIEILNPSALYNLCAGLDTKTKIIIRGNVGSFFASTVNGGDYHVFGNAGRSLFANATSGRCVVEGEADEGAGYCNQGADILIKGNTRPRTGIQMRGGNIITLECLVFGSGLYMAGGNMLCLGDKIGKALGPGMVSGDIYVPYCDKETLGIGTIEKCLEKEDMKNIENMLKIFPEHLKTEKISSFKLLINEKEYDFSGFRKINSR